jgi:hypothetical protein
MLSPFIKNRIDRFTQFIDHDQRAVHARAWDFVMPRQSQSQFPLSGENQSAQSSAALNDRIVRVGLNKGKKD